MPVTNFFPGEGRRKKWRSRRSNKVRLFPRRKGGRGLHAFLAKSAKIPSTLNKKKEKKKGTRLRDLTRRVPFPRKRKENQNWRKASWRKGGRGDTAFYAPRDAHFRGKKGPTPRGVHYISVQKKGGKKFFSPSPTQEEEGGERGKHPCFNSFH